jgi:hypothetical protein
MCCAAVMGCMCGYKPTERPPALATVAVTPTRRAEDLSDDELAAIITGEQPATSAPVEPGAEQLPPNKKVN